MRLLALLVSALITTLAPDAAPWATYRGNPQRTGNTDGQPGPARPKVLWALKSQDHFVAAPVLNGDRLFISGLGAFNVSTFYCLPVNGKSGPPAPLWSRTTPYLKLPTVSSPAIADGKLVFGDGMHQTDGAVLHCLRLDTGLPLWQLPVPGTLVHLEGSPTIANGRVYVGGGSAGVLCVDLNRATLDGQELGLAAIQAKLDAKWKELQAKYEADKKKDPDFAVPPNEDMLPKPAPKLLWKQGVGKWHVDAPVAVIGDRVLVCSAFLDKEQVGDRALFCLDAATGAIRWRAPLAINPWGGPAVQGDTVIVTGSSIGYDVDALKGAKGDVVAIDLAAGKQKWRKPVSAGILGSAALAGELAITTATDGKVRAFALATGDRRWIANGGAPCFAPAAIAGGFVYVGDLRGTVHAIELRSGRPVWRLDLGTDPAVKSPGMIYGAPAVQGGRIYVATCNLAGPNARQPTTIVCIGNQ